MVARLIAEPAVPDADVEAADGTDLSVEPVERVARTGASGVDGGSRERICLELRVAALEAALARARRRRALVVEHYERVLDGRGGKASPECSWRD